MRRWNETNVRTQLLEDVGEAWWNRDPSVHRKAQTVGLSVTVVRILSEDDDARVGERSRVERAKHLIVRRVHGSPGTLFGHESLKILPVGLTELGSQYRVPVGVHPDRK